MDNVKRFERVRAMQAKLNGQPEPPGLTVTSTPGPRPVFAYLPAAPGVTSTAVATKDGAKVTTTPTRMKTWAPSVPTAAEAHEDLERLREQERIALANGFSLKPPIYALGTRVNATGVANFTKSRLEFEKKAKAPELLGPFLQRIQREARRDATARARDLFLVDQGPNLGRLVATGPVDGSMTPPLLLGDGVLRDLLGRSGFREAGAAATYLAEIPVDRRVREFNAIMREAPEKNTAVLRHRNASGLIELPQAARELYAVVSEGYTVFDVDTVARLSLVDAFAPGDCRAELQYDGRRATFTLEWHSDIQPESACAGEVFRAFARITTADDGSASVYPSAGLTRNLCLNLIILDEATVSLGRRSHRGEAMDVGMFIGKALIEAVKLVKDFALMWDEGHLRSLRNCEVLRDVKAEAAPDELLVSGAFRGLLTEGSITMPGFRKEDAVKELVGAWKQDAQGDIVGLVNAATRVAHRSALRGPWAGDELERQAGQLLTRVKPISWMAEA